MWKDKLIEGVMEAIVGFFVSLAEGAIDLVVSLLGEIAQLSFNVVEFPAVKAAIIYSTAIGLSLVAVKIAWEAFVTYQLRVSGDSNADPGGLLIRAATSVALIAAIPTILSIMLLVSTTLIGDITNLPGMGADYEINKLTTIMSTLRPGTMIGGYIIMVIFIILAAIIGAIIILMQMAKRSAELAVVAITGAIMAIGINSNLFGTWWKHLLQLTVSHGIQIFMFKLSFYVLVQSWGDQDLLALFMFFGFIVTTISSPKILEKYIDNTGLGKAAGGAAQQVGSMYLMRKMLAR